jgi:hypothetical protein
MNTFLFINIIIASLNIFILVYAYSLNFFPFKWRKKIKQDSIVGLAIIFITMLNMFAWIIYFYYKLFEPLKIIESLLT